MFVFYILWPLRSCELLVLSLYKEEYLQIFKCVCPFDYTAVWLVGRFGDREPVKPHKLGGFRYTDWPP